MSTKSLSAENGTPTATGPTYISVRIYGRLFPQEDDAAADIDNFHSTPLMANDFGADAFMVSGIDDFLLDDMSDSLGGGNVSLDGPTLGSRRQTLDPNIARGRASASSPSKQNSYKSNIAFADGAFKITTGYKAVKVPTSISVFHLRSLLLDKFGISSDEAGEYYLSCVNKGENEKRFHNDDDIPLQLFPCSLVETGELRFYLNHNSLQDCRRKVTVDFNGASISLDVSPAEFTKNILAQALATKNITNTASYMLTNSDSTNNSSSALRAVPSNNDSVSNLTEWDLPYTFTNPCFVVNKVSSAGIISRVKSIGRRPRPRPTSALPSLNAIDDYMDNNGANSGEGDTKSLGGGGSPRFATKDKQRSRGDNFLKRRMSLKNVKRPTSSIELTENMLGDGLSNVSSTELADLLKSANSMAMKKEVWETTPGLFTSNIDDITKGGVELPDCLSLCMTKIEETGLKSRGIYRITGNVGKMKELKLAFHTGAEVNLEGHSVNTLAGIIKYFFMSLKEPMFGEAAVFSSFEKLEDPLEVIKGLKDIYQSLPQTNQFILNRLITHLQQIAVEHETNLMPEKNIAVVFSPGLQIPLNLLTIVFENYDPSWTTI